MWVRILRFAYVQHGLRTPLSDLNNVQRSFRVEDALLSFFNELPTGVSGLYELGGPHKQLYPDQVLEFEYPLGQSWLLNTQLPCCSRIVTDIRKHDRSLQQRNIRKFHSQLHENSACTSRRTRSKEQVDESTHLLSDNRQRGSFRFGISNIEAGIGQRSSPPLMLCTG